MIKTFKTMKTIYVNTIYGMTRIIAREILDGYEHNYFNQNDLENDIESARYEIIVDWAGLCSAEEYEKIVEDPNIYKNIYDEAFDKAKKAVLDIIF